MELLPMRKEFTDIEERVGPLNFKLSKTVPLSLFGFLFIQSATLIWYFSGQHHQFENYRDTTTERFETIKSQMGDRYRAAQAAADFKLRDERIQRNGDSIVSLTGMIVKLDDKIDTRFEKLFDLLHERETISRNAP